MKRWIRNHPNTMNLIAGLAVMFFLLYLDALIDDVGAGWEWMAQ